MALADRVEVGARGVEVGRALLAAGGVRARLAGREVREHLALVDGVADRDLDAAEDAVGVGDDLVLHLHRLEHDERGAGAHGLVGLVRDGDHGARERGGDGDVAIRRHRRIIAQAGAGVTPVGAVPVDAGSSSPWSRRNGGY